MIRSICLAIGTLVFVTNGETLLVPSQYPTIQEAANAAVPGDVIQIAAGTYQEFDILCSDVTILGETGNNEIPVTRIDSSNLGRSFICSGNQVSIQNIEFQNYAGPAIDANGVNDVVIANCWMSSQGFRSTSVSVLANSTLLQDCKFEMRNLSVSGFGDSPQVQVSNCHFDKSECNFSYISVFTDNCVFEGVNSVRIFAGENSGFVSSRTSKDSICNFTWTPNLPTNNRSLIIDDTVGSFSFDLRGPAQVQIMNSTIEALGQNSQDSADFAIRVVSEVDFALRESTVSNNVISGGGFGAAIENLGDSPILLDSSIICGNSPLNIYGLYSSENSLLLPNCGSFEGSCCSSSECLTVTEEECISLGGSWRGTNVPCSSVTCAPPDQFGTCCINDESIKLFESDCNRIGGSFEGSVRDGFVCPPSLTCEGDITNNDDVGLPDLIAVLSNWGPCPS